MSPPPPRPTRPPGVNEHPSPTTQEIMYKVASFALLPRCVSKRIQRVRVKVTT